MSTRLIGYIRPNDIRIVKNYPNMGAAIDSMRSAGFLINPPTPSTLKLLTNASLEKRPRPGRAVISKRATTTLLVISGEHLAFNACVKGDKLFATISDTSGIDFCNAGNVIAFMRRACDLPDGTCIFAAMEPVKDDEDHLSYFTIKMDNGHWTIDTMRYDSTVSIDEQQLWLVQLEE